MELMGMKITCEEYSKVNEHINSNYLPCEWNGIPEEDRREEIRTVLRGIRGK